MQVDERLGVFRFGLDFLVVGNYVLTSFEMYRSFFMCLDFMFCDFL